MLEESLVDETIDVTFSPIGSKCRPRRLRIAVAVVNG